MNSNHALCKLLGSWKDKDLKILLKMVYKTRSQLKESKVDINFKVQNIKIPQDDKVIDGNLMLHEVMAFLIYKLQAACAEIEQLKIIRSEDVEYQTGQVNWLNEQKELHEAINNGVMKQIELRGDMENLFAMMNRLSRTMEKITK